MASNFKKDVDAWIRKSERLTMAVVQTAAQEMIKEAMTPIARGGRLPVDTGYLRSSFVGSVGSMPTSGTGGEEQISAALLNWSAGQTFYVGITANYAPYMEARYSFLRLAAQNWQRHVNSAVKQVRERIK